MKISKDEKSFIEKTLAIKESREKGKTIELSKKNDIMWKLFRPRNFSVLLVILGLVFLVMFFVFLMNLEVMLGNELFVMLNEIGGTEEFYEILSETVNTKGIENIIEIYDIRHKIIGVVLTFLLFGVGTTIYLDIILKRKRDDVIEEEKHS